MFGSSEQEDEDGGENSLIQMRSEHFAPAGEPKKKKRPLNRDIFKLFGKGGSAHASAGGINENTDNAYQLELSQGYSQFSQNAYSQSSQSSFIGNYFGQMTVDDASSREGFKLHGAGVVGGASGAGAGTGSAGDCDAAAAAPVKGADVAAASGLQTVSAAAERERQISLPVSVQNPFLAPTHHQRHKTQQQMWISAFRPWPRYAWDFEPICQLGEGMASVVYCAKRRLDGALYAVKQLKRQIQTDAERALLLREACALAAFPACPHILRYHSSWIEDGYLYIQTELCAMGSLESLVGAVFFSNSDPFATQTGPGAGTRRQGSAEIEAEMAADDVEERGGGLFFSQSDSVLMSSECTDSQQQQHLKQQQQQQQQPLTGLALSQIDSNPFSQAVLEEGLVGAMQESQDVQESQGELGCPEVLVWKILTCIGASLAYLHSRDIVHLDVRPANLFVACGAAGQATCPASGERGRTAAAALNALLLSQPYHPNPDPTLLAHLLLLDLCSLRLGDLGQCCSAQATQFNEGESRYCPREVINGDMRLINLTRADVFSLGATCYELCLGRQLGAGGEGALEWHELRDGTLNAAFCQRYSPSLVALLRAMMHPTPTERPTAQQVVEFSRGVGPGPMAGVGTEQDELAILREENARLRELLR